MGENSVITVQTKSVYADSDDMLLAMFIRSKVSARTRNIYETSIKAFMDYTGSKPLRAVTLADALDYTEHLAGTTLAASTQRLHVNTLKSLFSFGQRVGYLTFNVFAAVKPPVVRSDLAQRILTEEQVLAMIHKTTKQRDSLLIRLLYASGGRISEVCGLTWGDVQPNGDTGQVTLFGKGGKTRAVKLSKATWQALQAYKQGEAPTDPVFRSQKGGKLTTVQVHRIVKQAAKQAGIPGDVSAHWLRHSHASHALDRGANIALVRDTLGHSSLAVTSRYTHAKPDDSSAMHLAI